MVYLIAQISLFILIATTLGVVLGWWFRGKQSTVDTRIELNEQDHKRRLEQCRKEAAALRREAKAQQETIDRFSRHKTDIDENTIAMELDNAQAKIKALLEELQLRDDTIAALQRDG